MDVKYSVTTYLCINTDKCVKPVSCMIMIDSDSWISTIMRHHVEKPVHYEKNPSDPAAASFICSNLSGRKKK